MDKDRLAYIIRRAAVQVDQWDNVEGGHGPDLDHLGERADTLIGILRELVQASGQYEQVQVPAHEVYCGKCGRTHADGRTCGEED